MLGRGIVCSLSNLAKFKDITTSHAPHINPSMCTTAKVNPGFPSMNLCLAKKVLQPCLREHSTPTNEVLCRVRNGCLCHCQALMMILVLEITEELGRIFTTTPSYLKQEDL
jgi:hypothetical protein